MNNNIIYIMWSADLRSSDDLFKAISVSCTVVLDASIAIL